MIGILSLGVLDAKVVDYQSERNVSAFMLEQARCMWGQVVPVGSKVRDEAILGELACLGEAIYSFVHRDGDGAVAGVFGHVIFGNDVGWDVVQFDGHVLGGGKGCAEVEVLDVGGHEFCIWLADNGVEEYFYQGHGGSVSGGVACVIYFVAADGASYPVQQYAVFDLGADLWIVVCGLGPSREIVTKYEFDSVRVKEPRDFLAMFG